MNSKLIKRLAAGIISTIAMFSFVGCSGCSGNNGDNSNEEPTYEFTGFIITETVTSEIGEYYLFEKPTVLVGEDTANVTIKVESQGKDVPHNDEQVYLDSMNEYIVTYTATYKGQSESKQTKVTPEDTTAPVYTNTLDRAVVYGEEITLSDYVYAQDFTGLKTTVYTVTNEDGTALPEGAFDSATTTLCINDVSIKKIKVKIEATDNYDNGSISDEYIIQLISLPKYGSFDFAGYTTGTTEMVGISVQTDSMNTYQMQIAEDNEGKYLSVTVTTTQTNQLVHVNFAQNLIGDFADFDFVDVTMQLDYTFDGESGGGGNGGLKDAEFDARPVNAPESNMFNTHRGEWFTYRYQSTEAKESIESNGGVCLLFKPWAAQTVTINVRLIKGGYDEKTVEQGKTLDLLELLGLTAEEITEAQFNGQTVEKFQQFKPTENGTITVTVNKENHKESVLSISIKVVSITVENDGTNDNDFDYDW